jgi:hypothetical protein
MGFAGWDEFWGFVRGRVEDSVAALVERLRGSGWDFRALDVGLFSKPIYHEYVVRYAPRGKPFEVDISRRHVIAWYRDGKSYHGFLFSEEGLGPNRGKLWVLEVDLDFSLINIRALATFENRQEGVTYRFVDDEDLVNEVLPFKRDLPDDGVVREAGSYRVLGEGLEMFVDDPDAFTDWYIDAYRESIDGLLRWVCIDEVAERLESVGVDASFWDFHPDGVSVDIPLQLLGLPPDAEKVYDHDELLRIAEERFHANRMGDAIMRLIGGREFTVNFLGLNIKCNVYLTVIRVFLGRLIVGIRASVEPPPETYRRVGDELLRYASSVRFDDVVRVGEYVVELRNVFRVGGAMPIPYTWFKELRRAKFVMSFKACLFHKGSECENGMWFYGVDDNSVVTARHPEYGERVVRFRGKFLLELNYVPDGWYDYRNKMQTLILEKLLNTK